MPKKGAKREAAQKAATQGNKAPVSNAAFTRRVVIATVAGAVVIAALVATLTFVLRGAPGIGNAAGGSSTTCASGGQSNTLQSGPARWDGQFGSAWTIDQSQQVTITPASGSVGAALQVAAQPLALSLGGQALSAPPAVTLNFTGKLTQGSIYPVTLSLPIAGCWKLSTQLQGKTSSIAVRADAPAGASACPASQPSSAVAPGDVFAYGADPVFWDATPPYMAHAPFLLTLRVTNGYQAPTMPLSAVQLANQGESLAFNAGQAQISSSDTGLFYQTTTPLTLGIPGCWLLVAHAGTSDGFIVVQVS